MAPTQHCVGFALVVVASLGHVLCFAPIQRKTRGGPLCMNFFKDMFLEAFANDPNLSFDKSEGQYDGPNDDPPTTTSASLTEVQRRWKESQSTQAKTRSNLAINKKLLEQTKWDIKMFLAGVPSKDPSNDLYGSKVNISSRDRKVGLNLPGEPSASVQVEFLPDGVCKALPSDFTSGQVDGQWKLSDDGTMLRFSIDVVGYSRTVQTKGTIIKVFWSDGDEQTTETSSTYSIPPGFLFADVAIGQGSQPGTLKIDDGVLRVEKKQGLLGAASKMIPCGGIQCIQVYERKPAKVEAALIQRRD